jgi:hypothetical protein
MFRQPVVTDYGRANADSVLAGKLVERNTLGFYVSHISQIYHCNLDAEAGILTRKRAYYCVLDFGRDCPRIERVRHHMLNRFAVAEADC